MFHGNQLDFTETKIKMRKRRPNGHPKTTCCKCDKEIEDTRLGQTYCKSCHAEYMRKTRRRHSELNPLAKKKANCRSYVNVYIRRGKIQKQPCEICGEKAEMHHDDYDKPLDIKWLCRNHHLEHHKNLATT